VANSEHLAVLDQGVVRWFRWREKNREIIPDLSGADLSRRDLHEMDLTGADLSGANLSEANLLLNTTT